ncbi:MAG: SLBB domain-containing protein, partial [Patescibacteria group bacterium]
MLSRVFTTREQLLLVGSAAAICIGGVTYYVAQPRIPAAAVEVRELQIPAPQKTVEPVSPPAAPIQQIIATPMAAPAHRISVSVSGAVTTPGMYELDQGDRVDDAINAAGGASATADLSDINKAAKLIDGSALVVPVGARAGIEEGKRLVLRSG